MNAPTSSARLTTYAVMLLTTLVGLVLVPSPASAAVHEKLIGGVIYTYDDATPDAGAVVTAYSAGSNQHGVGIVEAVTFDGVGSVPVKSINASVFMGKDLFSVGFVGDNLVTIGSNAFANNSLTNVEIPDSVTTIGDNAFLGNRLTDVTIGEGVSTIGTSAFYGNELASLDIPDGVEDIGPGAFGLNSLTSVVVGSSVSNVGEAAFAQNPALTSVRFTGPAPTVTAVGPNQSFDTTSGTFKVRYLPAYETQFVSPWHGYTTAPVGVAWTDANGISYMADGTDIAAGATVTTYAIPSGPIVTIPASVTFEGLTYAVTAIGVEAFQFKGLTRVTIPNTVKTIAEQAFQGDQLTSVTIPDSVTALGDYAFAQNSLSTLKISNNITSIGEYAFQQNLLKSITIPNSVTTIGEWAFANNQGKLTSVTIGSAVTSIGSYAFAQNEALSSVRFLGEAPAITAASTMQESLDTTSGALVVYYAAPFEAGFPNPWQGYTTTLFVPSSAATITGTPREGQILTAHAGPFGGLATLTYTWKADGRTISGATFSTLKLGKAQAGRRVTVTVTAAFSESSTLVRTSPATSIISSPYKRIVVSTPIVRRGHSFIVTATGFKPRQTVRIRLNNVTRWSGRANAYGTVRRTVTFKSGTPLGTRSVKVQYKSGGTWHTGISTSVRYVR